VKWQALPGAGGAGKGRGEIDVITLGESEIRYKQRDLGQERIHSNELS